MKPFIHILLFALFFITLCPAARLVAVKMQSACNVSCTADAGESESQACCPIEMCQQGNCCICIFLGPVEQHHFRIHLFEEYDKKNWEASTFIPSGFTSDCWQPPEILQS